MKIELLILGITGFLIFNTYHDGKYTKLLMSWKKYFQIGLIGLFGLSLYLLIKRNPAQSKNMLFHANNVIKYMPINRSSIDMISPILDFTNGNGFMESYNDEQTNEEQKTSFLGGFGMQPSERRMLQSGKNTTKRSVSETKKKYVAAQQNWKCGNCNIQLNHTFEVDHKTRLDNGGTNDVGNLVALCRECHGKKTAMENM